MVILRSGRILKTGCSSSSSSSVASISPKQVSHFKLPKKPGWTTVKKRADDPSMPYITEALKSYNQNSGKRYKLVDPGSLTTVILANYFLYHIDFEAKNTDAPHASTEMFFAELTSPSAWQVLSVRLCVSLGPVNSISGDIDKLNGCYYCRRLNNVHHPKAGGFVRGGDTFYKTVEDICGIKLNAEEKHLPMLKEVSQNFECNKESVIGEQVDDATPYSTEAITFFNRQPHRSYELMEPGFFTRVVLPTCSLIHVNFTAKETDVDVARELFFAELTSTGEVLSCNFCVRLHPRDSALGDETGDKTNGCYYCREYNNVLHPKRGGFVRGGDSLYKTFP
ncbi:hypothetical protein DCAR_0102014 [Daucus carota subsp. sativus]|uniref:DUF3615 domain-containing protein n=1 Tax=Daucus carota subsp. sativus TaxID=79200 RepID=A0AAF1AJU2_DAUCS|nr:PREDICTED: uncharacterized protein LOC108215051 [Daucus carota subsp. sativus]WOG82846.1 hypothetical protein DCAR_0102014 [Daucus carota subsp. sativus]